jgi:hypothetical protein
MIDREMENESSLEDQKVNVNIWLALAMENLLDIDCRLTSHSLSLERVKLGVGTVSFLHIFSLEKEKMIFRRNKENYCFHNLSLERLHFLRMPQEMLNVCSSKPAMVNDSDILLAGEMRKELLISDICPVKRTVPFRCTDRSSHWRNCLTFLVISCCSVWL